MDCWLRGLSWEGFRLLSPHFLFGIFKALSHKVDGLVLCDWVLLQAGLAGVKGQHLGFVCQAVLSGKKGKKQNSDQMFNIFAWYLSYEKIQFATCKAAQDFFFSMTVSAANAKQEVQPH